MLRRVSLLSRLSLERSKIWNVCRYDKQYWISTSAIDSHCVLTQVRGVGGCFSGTGRCQSNWSHQSSTLSAFAEPTRAAAPTSVPSGPNQTTTKLKGNFYDMGKLVTHDAVPQLVPSPVTDQRSSGIAALDRMIQRNLACAKANADIILKAHPWICFNTGAPFSGKTTLLRMSCTHFASSAADTLFSTPAGSRPRHSIFITMNGEESLLAIEAGDSPAARVYNRIMFALRDDTKRNLHLFLREDKQTLSSWIPKDDPQRVINRIQEKFRDDPHILIAADDLRLLGPDCPAHERSPECQAGLAALNALVRMTPSPRKGNRKGQIFVVASSSSAMDIHEFSTRSQTPFTLQSMVPPTLTTVRKILNSVGITPASRWTPDNAATTIKILHHSSLDMSLLHEVQMFNCETGTQAVNECRERVEKLIEMRSATPDTYSTAVTTYLLKVHGGAVNSGEKVTTIYELLRSLFRAHPRDPRNCFDGFLRPALEASCYDVCQIVSTDEGESVLMHPSVMKELCRVVFRACSIVSAARSAEQREFASAVWNVATKLEEVSSPLAWLPSQVGHVPPKPLEQCPPEGWLSARCVRPQEAAQTTPFELLIKHLLRCVQLTNHQPSLKQLLVLQQRPQPSPWSSARIAAIEMDRFQSIRCRDWEPQIFFGGNRMCQHGFDIISQRPIVCTQLHKDSPLLDLAVTAGLISSTRNLCLAIQCKEPDGNLVPRGDRFEELTRWRSRVTKSREAQKGRKAFNEKADVLWVMVCINTPRADQEGFTDSAAGSEKPQPESFALEADEAFLTLEDATRWCPSLIFAKRASDLASDKN